MGKARKCEHMRASYTFRDAPARHGFYNTEWAPDFGYDDDVTGAKCDSCGATLPLGPSNDDSDAVRVEIRAAEIAASKRGEPGYLRGESEVSGWTDHWMCGDLMDEEPWEWAAGWISREISTHDDREARDAPAWPWDPTRPLAGQYELATQSCPVDHGHAKSVIALADGIVEAGGTLPYPGTAVNGTVADAVAFPDHPLTAADYESQRAAEPDCRDEDGPEVERLMAEVEVPGNTNAALASIGPLMTAAEADELRLELRRDDDDAPACGAGQMTERPRIPTLDETLDRWDGVMRGLAEIERQERASGDRVDEAAHVPPTAANCKLLGAERCEHDPTASSDKTESSNG